MKNILKKLPSFTLLGLLLVAFLNSPLAAKDKVLSGKPIKIHGVIIERFSNSFTLRDYRGTEMIVDLTGTTEIEEQKRNFLREPKPYSPRHLIPGLDVSVKGVPNSGHILAEEVKFTQDALTVARTIFSRVQPIEKELDETHTRLDMVQSRVGKNEEKGQMLSGEVEELKIGFKLTRRQLRNAETTAQQALVGVAATNKRVSLLDEYRTLQTLTLHFPFNSAEIPTEAQSELDQVFEGMTNQTGYLVEIRGFASADGDEAYNRRLSQRRAETVRRYLAEKHPIAMRRFVVPYGYGTQYPVADDSTLEGRKENRRVEVRILVSRGLEESGAFTALATTHNPFR